MELLQEAKSTADATNNTKGCLQEAGPANVDDKDSDDESFCDCVQKAVSNKNLRGAGVLFLK